MWKNSTELLDYALRELQVAIYNGKKEVEIVLKEHCKKDIEQVKEIDNRLEIQTLTEMLREKFYNYDIKSVVGLGHLNFAIKHMDTPCDLFYPIVWKLILQKK